MQASFVLTGLHMIVHGHSDQCIGGALGLSPGTRIVIHHHDRMPFPEREGVTAGPGHAYSISVKSILHSRLASHYHQCSDTSSNHYQQSNMFKELYNVDYSQQVM